MKNSWTKEEKATFRTQHPTKYPIKQANHNSPKADVKTFADLIYAADRPEYKGIVTIARRPKGTSTMETVASVPAEQVGEWLSQMHVSADADYYITKAQFKAAQTWDTGELFALNAIWVDIDAHEKASNCPNPEDALSLLSQGLEIWTELPEPNIVVYSGRGFHLIWLIGQCAASLGFMASEISKHIGNAIQNLLTDLQIIGYSVDSGYCSNIAGLTRIPGTFNTHANNYCTCEIRHSVRMSLVEEYKDLQFYPRKSIATSEPCYRYMPTSAQAAGELRVNALLKLLELRTNWEGYRDYFLLILFSACQMAGYRSKKVEVFADHEIAALAQKVLDAPDITGLCVLLILNTGLRLGEICALRKSDIDFRSGFLRIERSVARVRDASGTHLVVQSPKSNSSVRLVATPNDMLELLKTATQNIQKDNYLLTNTNTPMEPRTLQYRYRKLLERCGTRYRNFHAMRHTYATRCMESGVDIKSLSELLGHADIRTTLQTYVHSSLAHKKQAVQSICFLPIESTWGSLTPSKIPSEMPQSDALQRRADAGVVNCI